MLTLSPTNTIQGLGSGLVYAIAGLEIASGVEVYKTLAQGQVQSSVGILYATVDKTALVKTLHFKNTTGSPVPLAVYLNGSAISNQIFSGIVPANGTCLYDGKWNLYDSSGIVQFVGSAGPQGEPGIQGDQGIQGIPGPPGEVPASRQVLAGAGLSGGWQSIC